MHHHRRKSGHASTSSSMTTLDSSKQKASRPPIMSRRSTTQIAQKLGKNPRDREREWQEERWWEDERSSFPQYCMTCEKQFVPQDDRFLYCSETCRIHDQESTSASPSMFSTRHSTSTYPTYSSGLKEARDIVPRASPSRPSSTHFSPPTSPSMTSAISALRSLSIRPPSPPSPTGTYHANIWPFGTRSPATTSPSTSYTRPSSTFFSSTYDAAYYTSHSPAMDRPLPTRRPGAYSRPKSIELVTPMVGR